MQPQNQNQDQPHDQNQPTPDPHAAPPVPVQGNGVPDYSHVHLDTAPEAPVEEATGPGGSATEAESGGGYSG